MVLEATALTGLPGGLPRDLDDESLRGIARSFYLVRMARYGGLLVASVAIGVLAAARGAPPWVWVAMFVLAVAFVAAMALTRRRYVRSASPTS